MKRPDQPIEKDRGAIPARPSLWLLGPPRPGRESSALPTTLLGYIRATSATRQIWLIALSLLVAFLDTVPIEIQRRIVNQAIKLGDLELIGFLAFSYVVLAAGQGITKMIANIFRAWVSESAVLQLRLFISRADHGANAPDISAESRGVEISMLVAECDAIGGFIGDAISEPALQAGTLVNVAVYLFFIQPLMAGLTLATLLPQLIFIPLLQRAINKRVQSRIAILRETSSGVVGAAAQAEVLAQQYDQFHQVFSLNMGIFELKYSLNFLMNFMYQIGVAMILGVGGWLVVIGRTETGTLVAFLSALSTIRGPWGDLVNWFQAYSVTRAKYLLVERTLRRAPSERATPA